MTDLTVTSPLLDGADRMILALQAFEIETDWDYETLNAETRSAATARREIEAERIDIVRKHRVALDASTKRHVAQIEKLDTAIAVADKKLIDYHDAKEAQRREAQRLLDEEAAAARKRLQDEADKLAAKAEGLEAKGDTIKAESAQHQAAVIADAAALVVSQAADVGLVKASGTAVVTRYGFEVLDLMDLAKAVVAGTVPLIAILPNEVWIGGRARNDKDEFNVPGCRLTKSKTASHRGLR